MYAHSHPWVAITPPRVVVARGGHWNTVDLRRLYVVEREGTHVVSLADVWVASELSGDLFALAFDFLDGEGHSASRRGEPRLDSKRFVKGWLDVETRDLSWDDEARVPKHWHMKSVATVVAVSSNKGGGRRPWW